MTAVDDLGLHADRRLTEPEDPDDLERVGKAGKTGTRGIPHRPHGHVVPLPDDGCRALVQQKAVDVEPVDGIVDRQSISAALKQKLPVLRPVRRKEQRDAVILRMGQQFVFVAAPVENIAGNGLEEKPHQIAGRAEGRLKIGRFDIHLSNLRTHQERKSGTAIFSPAGRGFHSPVSKSANRHVPAAAPGRVTRTPEQTFPV